MAAVAITVCTGLITADFKSHHRISTHIKSRVNANAISIISHSIINLFFTFQAK